MSLNLKKPLLIILVVTVALLGGAVVAGSLFLNTTPGRGLLSELAEAQLSNALNSETDIGQIKGSLPGHIIIEDVVFSDDDGVWLSAAKLELRWHPLALIRKRISVEEISLTGVSLLRNPPQKEAKEEDARRIKIIQDLPQIDVYSINLIDINTNLNGNQQRIDGTGAIYLEGTEIDLRLTITSDGGADHADVTFQKSPRNNRIFIDTTLTAEPGGVIATLGGLNAPLRFAATGDSALNDAVIEVNSNIGNYGNLEGSFRSNFVSFSGSDITLNFVPGSRLNDIPELSAPLVLDARYDTKPNGGSVTIQKLTAAVGAVDGLFAWQAPDGLVEQLSTNLSIGFGPEYQSQLQSLIGETVNLDATLDWRRDDYALSATMTGDGGTAIITDGTTDLRKVFAGDVELTLAPNKNFSAALANGLSVNGNIDTNLDDRIRLSGIKALTSDGTTINVNGTYNTTTNALAFSGDLDVTPNYVRLFSSNISPEKNFTGEIELGGTLNRFTINTELEAPKLSTESGSVPALSINAAIAGLPKFPNGDITARAIDGGPRKLDASIRTSNDGSIRLPTISYAGHGFNLGGNVNIDSTLQTINLDLTYNGDEGAAPWPGIDLVGDIAAKGVLSRNDALNNMVVNADHIAFNNLAANGLAIDAQGPPGAIAVSLKAKSFAAPGTETIENIAAKAQINARKNIIVRLNSLEALVFATDAKLTAPAVITLRDGVLIENLRMAYGAKGNISLDGALEETRWRADAVFDQVNIPNADGRISMTLALDTDKEIPAETDFHLRSLLLTEEDASIRGKAVWDGSQMRITDDGSDDRLDMDIRLPARLTRKPSVSIETSGELTGRIAYNGDIQAIAAYLPPTIQTIEGALSATFNLAGDTENPIISGKAELTEGAYTEIETGFSLAGIHMEANADYTGPDSTLVLTGGGRGAGQSGGDTIKFDGDIRLGENSNLDFNLNLDGAELSAAPVNKVLADGKITVSGPLDKLVAGGEIDITELDAEIVTPENTGLVGIDIIAYNEENTAPTELAPTPKSGIDFNVKVTADDRIFIRGRGLESEWAANVVANNDRGQAIMLGDLTLRRGWLDFSGRRFDLTRGQIAFDRINPNNPLLDIRAELNTGDGVTAAIVISGRATEPSIELESTPSLPSEDVMSLVLFGKPAQNLSAFESLQTAEALASLGGIGPFGGEGITGKLRRSVGLDLLNVDIDPEKGGGSLTAGKYVADGFFVSASQDTDGGNGSVRVKYDVTDSITIETELEQTGDQTISANWKHDF
ncbi:translocation/assembly module TamB domain-containing protein [Hyphococcus lacteus]|uniref:Translocation/assembly module TamB domain-containing protein n=1 Tax=Hyphococcus lacteus TaxID=3143536 RepID=A0ABV3Z540_9PROT